MNSTHNNATSSSDNAVSSHHVQPLGASSSSQHSSSSTEGGGRDSSNSNTFNGSGGGGGHSSFVVESSSSLHETAHHHHQHPSSSNGGSPLSSSGDHRDSNELASPWWLSPAKATVLRRAVALGLTLWMLVSLIDWAKWKNLFQLHPLCMVLAYVSLLPELLSDAFAMKRQRTIQRRQEVERLHVYAAYGMKLFALIGFCAVFFNKSNHGKPHFVSWHGIFGALTVLALAAQIVLGAILYYRKPLFLATTSARMTLRSLHKWSGYLQLAMGIASMWLGFQSFWAMRIVPVVFMRWIFAIACPSLIAWVWFRER